MIDYAKISVLAGDGGRGAGSFRSNKGKRRGKADGGSGGNGGNVYIEATQNLNTLEPYRFVKKYSAKNGANGFSNLRRGATADDLILKVPVGTQVRVRESESQSQSHSQSHSQSQRDESESKVRVKSQKVSGSKSEVIRGVLSTLHFDYDLVHDGERVLVARGGEGGRGNAYLRDEYGRRPFTGAAGSAGEEVFLTLELKLIADVGLIGLPNAGKSTLLAALTAAKPEIAPYPFTTLEPNLGVLKVKVESQSGKSNVEKGLTTNHYDFDSKRSLVLADIPGLIEGASEGKGLGHLFLRHIERTKMLVHLIDISEGDAMAKYQTVREELKVYSKELAKKKEIVVLNKADLVDSDVISAARLIFSEKRKKVFLISAANGEGVDALVGEIVRRLRETSV